MAQKLSELALGYSLAIVCAAGMLLIGLFGYMGIYPGMVSGMMQWHMYFAVSPFGIITGMIEAAVWGFVAGYAIAYAYNRFS